MPVAWLKDEAKANRIPHLRVGRRCLFSLEAVTEALAERECGCGAEGVKDD